MGAYNTLLRNAEQRAAAGIWPQSSANKYFIFCVGQDFIKVHAFMSFAANNDIRVKPLVGMYKGQSERSFIANMNDYPEIEPWLVAEESILILGRCNGQGEPTATLHYLSSNENVHMGRLVQVSRTAALRHDSWTFCPIIGCYYVCVA